MLFVFIKIRPIVLLVQIYELGYQVLHCQGFVNQLYRTNFFASTCESMIIIRLQCLTSILNGLYVHKRYY